MELVSYISNESLKDGSTQGDPWGGATLTEKDTI
jgi:hypothetical protein